MPATQSGVALDVPIDLPEVNWAGTVSAVSVGNPHAVLYVEPEFLSQSPRDRVAEVGAVLERHAAFPNRVNVHFVAIKSPSEITMRTWERGTGLTLACGTGACAVAVAGLLTGRTGPKLLAHLPGGDLLLEWAGNDAPDLYDRGRGRSLLGRLAVVKIRNPVLVRAAGRLGVTLAQLLVGSLRIELRCLGETTLPVGNTSPEARYAYAVWHEYLLVPTVRYGHPDLAALVSKHADGQILAELIRAKGMAIVAGSTNRGGIEAVRKIVSGVAGRRHLVVTPDGPRGPRRRVQGGLVYAASRVGLQVVPLGFAFEKAFRLKSWDRFAVPRPGSKVWCVAGRPVAVPAGIRGGELDHWGSVVQSALDATVHAAECWRRGVKPESVTS